MFAKQAARLYDAFATSAHRERNVLIALAVYTVLWTIYGTIAKGSQGLHYDMVELIAWSREPALGYLKHPPFGAWLLAVWFGVVPVAEWSYYLLAMLMPAIALWIAWRLSADYLPADKRIAGLALLMLVPFFNFHALKFNANTVLIPLWAITTLLFLRSYVTRSALYAALAGVAAAASMLGKYWSIFLLAGLALSALIDQRRAAYFKSAAPWITIIVGFVVLAPHLIWLKQNDFLPFRYAMSIHGEKPFATAAVGVLGYLFGSLAYVAVPLIAVAIAARPNASTASDMLWPNDTDRRLAAAAFWGPFLLPAIFALASGTEITSLWSMSAWTLLPVLLLSSPKVTLKPVDQRRIFIGAVVVPLVMIVLSPFVALRVHKAGPNLRQAHSQQLAEQVQKLWRDATALPLTFVGGDEDLAYGVAAYASDKPRAMSVRPQASEDAILKTGAAFVCFAEDNGCRQRAAEHVGKLQVLRGAQIELTRSYFGEPGQPRKYAIIILGPR